MIALVDRVHQRFWQVAGVVPGGDRLRADRRTRAIALAGIHLSLGLVLTGLAPMWVLLVGPLVLGVPHVAGDLRHLLLRPPTPLPRLFVGALLIPLGLMTALRVASMAGFGSFASVEIALGAIAVALGALWARGRPLVQGAIGLGAVGLLVAAWARPGEAALILGHAHNVVALALWTWWVGPGRGRWLVPLAAAAAVALILAGGLDPLVAATGGLEPVGGLDLATMSATLAPSLPHPWAQRAVLAFTALQALHYSLWIWCIPAAPTFAREAAPTAPRAAWRQWWADLGTPLAVAVILGAIALPIAGLFDPAQLRAGYLSLVLFHGWLELAVAAHLLALRHAPA